MANSDVTLDWRGDLVFELIGDAVLESIDETTAEGAIKAREEAPRDTGHLASGMHNEPAERKGDEIVGRWGPDRASWHAAPVEALHPTKAGFMRRINDAVGRKLAGRIAARVK